MTKTETTAGNRERLTRERVIEAALRIMDAEGLDAVTMRRVAREVGVEAMSLYNHVRDKDDLLDGIRFLVFSEFAYPTLGLDPYENGRRIAQAWRHLLKSHPHLLELLAEEREPPLSMEAFRAMEMALAVLRSMGIPEEEVVQVFHAFGGYIQGFTMMEHQLDFGGRKAGMAELEGRIDPGELPCLAAALPYMADCDIESQFDLGLELMLDGMRTRYGANVQG